MRKRKETETIKITLLCVVVVLLHLGIFRWRGILDGDGGVVGTARARECVATEGILVQA